MEELRMVYRCKMCGKLYRSEFKPLSEDFDPTENMSWSTTPPNHSCCINETYQQYGYWESVGHEVREVKMGPDGPIAFIPTTIRGERGFVLRELEGVEE